MRVPTYSRAAGFAKLSGFIDTWSGRQDHAFILLALQTGLRLSEMTSLKRENLILGVGNLAAHGVRAEGPPAKAPGVDIFLKSLSSAWKDGDARPTHRKQPKAKHWWRSRVDPFADAWSVLKAG